MHYTLLTRRRPRVGRAEWQDNVDRANVNAPGAFYAPFSVEGGGQVFKGEASFDRAVEPAPLTGDTAGIDPEKWKRFFVFVGCHV